MSATFYNPKREENKSVQFTKGAFSTHTKKNPEFFSVSLANCFYSDLFEIRKSAATPTAAAAKRNYPFKIIALQCPNAVKKEMKYDRKPKATEREQESAIFSQSRNENRREKKT